MKRFLVAYAFVATVGLGLVAVHEYRRAELLEQRLATVSLAAAPSVSSAELAPSNVQRLEENVRRTKQEAADFRYELGRLSGRIPAPGAAKGSRRDAADPPKP